MGGVNNVSLANRLMMSASSLAANRSAGRPLHNTTLILCHKGCKKWCVDTNVAHAARLAGSMKSPSSRVHFPRGSTSTQWGSIRFSSAPRTYGAPPCGPSARVVPDRLTESLEIPTRKILPPFCLGRRAGRSRRPPRRHDHGRTRRVRLRLRVRLGERADGRGSEAAAVAVEVEVE